MSIQIIITGDTSAHALRELRGLSAGLSPEPVQTTVAPMADSAPDTRPTAEEVPAGEERTMPDEQPKRRGRPPKAKPETVEAGEQTFGRVDEAGDVALPLSEPAADAPEAASEASSGPSEDTPASTSATTAGDEKPFTQDDLIRALNDLLLQENGKAKAQAVLAEFGATRQSQIDPAQYKAFIAAIAKARGL